MTEVATIEHSARTGLSGGQPFCPHGLRPSPDSAGKLGPLGIGRCLTPILATDKPLRCRVVRRRQGRHRYLPDSSRNSHATTVFTQSRGGKSLEPTKQFLVTQSSTLAPDHIPRSGSGLFENARKSRL
jgi:hypothetical protein